RSRAAKGGRSDEEGAGQQAGRAGAAGRVKEKKSVSRKGARSAKEENELSSLCVPGAFARNTLLESDSAMLTVLYEDNHCLAVIKPAGLSTQAPAGSPSLESLARAYLKAKYHKPGNVYLGIPHRLDRPVSGVVLFARQTASAQRLAEQFRDRQVKKVYW